LSGSFRLDVENVPEDWAVKAILLDGTDVTDEAIELNGRTSTIRVVMTDRVTSVNGSIRTGRSRRGQSVIVFADDTARWTYPSRYVKAGRVDDEGRFRIQGLPPNERYLAAALQGLDDGEEQDPQLLERLRSRATSFSLREGEQRSIQLDVIDR
jgi:hypothetical protein